MTRAMTLIALAAVMTFAAAASADESRPPQAWESYEWRASTYAVSAQHEAALALTPSGDVVSVWSSRRQLGGRSGVYAQRFAGDGAPLGTETAVGIWQQCHQTAPAVACDRDGNTWIVWQSHGQDGDAGAIIARRFDAKFVGGPEILVNQTSAGHQSNPVIAVTPHGDAVVVWSSQAPRAKAPRVFGRIIRPDGTPACGEFTVADTERAEYTPALAVGADGSFAVAYSLFDDQMNPAGVYLQRFGADGERAGDAIRMNAPDARSPIEPVVAAAPWGYLAVWAETGPDSADYDVVARRFDTDVAPLGQPFVVPSDNRGPQNAAAIAVDRQGRFAIAFNSPDADEDGVFVRMYEGDGTAVGDAFRLNEHTKGNQRLHAATGTTRLGFGPTGALYGVWNGDAGHDDTTSVNVTMRSPAALRVARESQGVRPGMPAAQVAETFAAEPHRPPEFDPKTIDDGPREFREVDGFGFTAITSTGWTPPDPHLAVGPNHLVAMTNGAIAFFTKTGTLTFQDEIEDSYGFWGSVGATGFVFDPEVIYDDLSGRFFAMAAEGYAPPGQTRSYVLIAVSDDADPNGIWYRYRIDTTTLNGNLFDSPNIGVDANYVYITGDGFGAGQVYSIYILAKAPMLNGQPAQLLHSMTMPTTTQSAGIPPVSYDDPPALYMIEHAESATNYHVRLIALRTPGGIPSFSYYTLPVYPYAPPEDPPQLGTTVRPETFDARFWSVAYRNGSLWATHHVNASRVRARWYEIAMNGWPTSGNNPAVVQYGEIDLGGTVRTFFGSITVDAAGNAAITCARSSPTEYISMITAWRRPSDPLGTFQTPVIEKASTGPYTSSRWGDYSAVLPDPAQPRTFWAHHEYASGSWRTWIARIDVPVTIGDMDCDGDVDFDDIDPFVVALEGQAAYEAAYPNCEWLHADVNGDGTVDFDDIDPFILLLE